MKLLKAKNDTLEAVFSSVRDHALACEGFDYPRWLAAQVRRACATGVRGTLLCAQRDRQAVEALLRQAGAGGITLAPTPGSMRGGVYLEGEGVDLDLTLDAALADLRDELAMSLAQRLFGDVPALSDAGPAPGD
jgi:vacuolar-type H+-ATPase subunit E/Vma4